MEDPKKVLLVTNAINDTELNLIQQALKEGLQHNIEIKLSLVHIVPNLPSCYFNIPSMVLMADQYYQEAKNYLTMVGDALNIPKRDQWLITGRLKTEVLRLTEKLDCDYILASSNHIQELQQAFTFKKEHLTFLFRDINTYSSL